MSGISHVLSAISVFLVISVLKFAVCEDPCLVTDYNQVPLAIANCQTIILSSLDVPGGEQLALHLQENTTVIFKGKTTFGYSEWTGPLISLKGTNVTVKGDEGSSLEGQGSLYWDGQGTHFNNNKPRFIRITVKNAILENVNIFNCPVLCVLIRSSEDFVLRNWVIDNLAGDEGVVPKNKSAHNTDGFNLEDVNNAVIEHSKVFNQDDCVVIASGANVTIKNILCHGSHGLSIRGVGSTLTNVTFSDSILTMGQNGIHVKTANEGNVGLVKDITYSNITILDSLNYGIRIQQNYPSGEPKNNIPIYNLKLKNIYGNVVSGGTPVSILCAENGCFDWEWDQVSIIGINKNNCTNYIPKGYEC